MFYLLVFLIILLSKYQNSHCLNSYIYLPDKYINEELSIGSQIIDLVDELNSYFDKIASNNGLLTSNEKKSILELKSQLRNQQYSFLEDIKQQTSDQTYYLLDSITGRITTKRYLDRESMCLNKHCLETCDVLLINTNNTGSSCKMNLKILLIPSYNIISMNVIVQDINDNKPYFTSDLLNQTIPENVPIGHRIPIDLAYDADSGINSIQFYQLISLENDTETFELVQNLNELQLGLIVRKKLDREEKAYYHYKLIAYDGGQPVPNTGELEIYLIISDINDNNPKFKQDLYTFTIPEDLSVGSEIGKIEAFDLDEGLNGLIKYRIVNNNENQAFASIVSSDNDDDNNNKYFHLNDTTGILTLKSELDYELEQFYSLTIEAKDSGVGSLPAYAQIEIFIIDANDNSPEISVSFLNTLYKNTTIDNKVNIYLSEFINQNKYLAHVSIFDKDSLDNGKIDWKVFIDENEFLSNSKQQLIQVNKLNSNSFTINTGVISRNLSAFIYDREQLSSFKVCIKVWDFGKPEFKMTFYNFTVNLIDENDNSPKFDKTQYNFIIYENNAINFTIGHVNATDADEGENANITYKIKDSEYEKYFSIDPLTGMLSAIKSLDREEKPIYRFQVLAIDNGKPPLTASTFVRIDLVDLNDNAPKILFNSSYLSKEQLPNKNLIILKLDEDLPIDSQIIKFYANDPDDGENSKVKFSIKKLVKQDDQQQILSQQLPFRLSANGDLKLVNKLDREKIDKYEITIQCQDLASIPVKTKYLTSEMNLLVYISDVNDNCPQTLISSSINETRVKYINKDQILNPRPSHDTSKLYLIFESNYTDADLGTNGEMRFDLLSYTELIELRETQIRVNLNQLIYKIQLRLKISNTSSSKVLLNSLFKLGKYVIKIRISDKGEPSCSIIENYILFVGDNEYKTKNDVLILIKKSLQNENNFYLNLQIDDENESLDVSTQTNNNNSKFKLKQQKQQQPPLKILQNKFFSHNDYILTIAVIAIIIIVLIFFTLICTIYFYNRYRQNNKKENKKVKIIEKDNLLKSPGDSSVNHEILYSNTDGNRLSLSFKSTDTDQSNSIDSITSSTLTKDTKTSTNESHQQQQQAHKTVHYSATTTFQRDTPTLRTGQKKFLTKDFNNGTLKYSSVSGFVSNEDCAYKTANNYKSILKDCSKKRYGYDDRKLDCQNDSLDINDIDEECTSFLTARIKNHNPSTQYDYKSSAV